MLFYSLIYYNEASFPAACYNRKIIFSYLWKKKFVALFEIFGQIFCIYRKEIEFSDYRKQLIMKKNILRVYYRILNIYLLAYRKLKSVSILNLYLSISASHWRKCLKKKSSVSHELSVDLTSTHLKKWYVLQKPLNWLIYLLLTL